MRFLSEIYIFVYMKWIFKILTLCVAATALGCISDGHEDPDETTLVKIGQVAPDFTAQLYPEGEVTLSSLRGKIVLLTLWDPECPTCRKEISMAQERIIDHFKGKEFHYLPIARGQGYDLIKGFCEANGYTFPIGLDPRREIYSLYATLYVPRSFIIDRQGVIRSIEVEYEFDQLDEIVYTIESML